MGGWQSTRTSGLVKRGKLLKDETIFLGAECQALCRAVNGAVYFSHYNKVRPVPAQDILKHAPSFRETTSGMITRVTAAVSRLVPGLEASVVATVVMMM